MSTEARKVMTMSMVKITTSRQRKSGINLRQNLLVANVMLNARSVFISATTPKKRELKRQRRITMLKTTPTGAAKTAPSVCLDALQATPPKLARMDAVNDDDAVVPDMDCASTGPDPTSGDQDDEDNMSSVSEGKPDLLTISKPHKRLHRELEDGELEDCEDEDLQDGNLDREPLCKQANLRCPRVEITSLNNLVNRFNGLLEVDCNHNELDEVDQHDVVDDNDEPTTDGFISSCSSKVIEYDMSTRSIRLEV